MQQFIFEGHYLLRTKRFFNRHLMGLLAIWFMTVTGLSTIAALAAYLFRELDQPFVRHFLGGLGFRTDLSRGFFPVTVLLVLWCIFWCLSFFRASGNMARAQGRAAARLMPIIVVTFGICVAALIGNGEFSLEWISRPNGVDIAGLFKSAEQFFQVAIYGIIGVGLLPFLNPAALIRSGAKPKTTKDRVVFAVASRVLLYGLPFLLVSWFACENISTWTEHRFVPDAIRQAGLRQDISVPAGSKNLFQTKDGVSKDGIHNAVIESQSPPVDNWNDYVALTRHEIDQWNDWRPAWAPFWLKLRAQAARDREARLAPVFKAEAAAWDARVVLLAKEAVAKAAKDSTSEASSAALNAQEALSQQEVESRQKARDEAEMLAEIAQTEADQARAEKVRLEKVAKLVRDTAESSKRRIAEFIWDELRESIKSDGSGRPGTFVELEKVPPRDTEPSPPYGNVTFNSVEEVLGLIHVESLALQELYAWSDQNTVASAPDRPRLILNRLLSLFAVGPNYLQGEFAQNHLGEFVIRRQRLARLRNWLADHLSRILETENLGVACHWESSVLDEPGPLASSIEQAGEMERRYSVGGAVHNHRAPIIGLTSLSSVERRDLAQLNRTMLNESFKGTLRNPEMVFAANVLEFDQARRWTMFWICLGFFLFGSLMININATTLHGFYARELANNWIEADEDTDLPLSSADATDQCLPYHIMSGSVHWLGKRRKAKGDLLRDHFLLSPIYCGCEKTGFVATNRYKDDELGLGDAIAISGAAITPTQQGNPLLQALLWLANLRLGQWLPNPSFGTILPTKSRSIVERSSVTPMRLMWRLCQVAERRPFLFVTDGGHHENLGIGPLLKRRCRFILAVDAGEDADYAFTDLSTLMRWARVKHNVKLQPVDSQIEPVDLTSGGALATTVAGKTDVPGKVRSAIDAWNDLAPDSDTRLSVDRLSRRHFVVLRIHYPDVEGPSWLVFAKTSLTGDEPAELIRYAEGSKQFPHDPTSNQFYAPDTFEAYRQLGEHIVDSMVGQLPSIIAGKMDEHENRPEAPYLGAMLQQIDLAKKKTLPLSLTAAPPTPEAVDLVEQLRKGDGQADLQVKLSKRLSLHPLFVSSLLHAALQTSVRLNSSLFAFLSPELGPETSPARRIFTERRLPGRAEAMRSFKPKDDHTPDEELVKKLIKLADHLAIVPDEAPDFQHDEQIEEYAAVYQLLTNLRPQISERQLKDKINRLPSEAKKAAKKRKKTARRKSSDAPSVD